MKILLVIFQEKKFVWDNLIFLAFGFYCLIGYGQIEPGYYC